jgi:hypothetical protein
VVYLKLKRGASRIKNINDPSGESRHARRNLPKDFSFPMKWIKIINEHYSISENGMLKNELTGKILKVRIDNKGYHKCNLYNGEGKSKGYLAHRLVALNFLPAPKPGQIQINHIDGNPLNNHYTNLEWVTAKENSEHAVKTGLFPRGETHHLAKITDDQVREIRLMWETGRYFQWEIADTFNINQSEVSRYINFKRRGGRCA